MRNTPAVMQGPAGVWDMHQHIPLNLRQQPGNPPNREGSWQQYDGPPFRGGQSPQESENMANTKNPERAPPSTEPSEPLISRDVLLELCAPFVSDMLYEVQRAVDEPSTKSSVSRDILLELCAPFVSDMLYEVQRAVDERYSEAMKSLVQIIGSFKPVEQQAVASDGFMAGSQRPLAKERQAMDPHYNLPQEIPSYGRAAAFVQQRGDSTQFHSGAGNHGNHGAYSRESSLSEPDDMGQRATPQQGPDKYRVSGKGQAVPGNHGSTFGAAAPVNWVHMVPPNAAAASVEEAHHARHQSSDAINRDASSPDGHGAADAPVDVVCRHWTTRGWCRMQANCKFLHPEELRGSLMPPMPEAVHSGKSQATQLPSERVEQKRQKARVLGRQKGK